MADNKDTADLFDGMEDLGELEEFGDEDFQDLLGDVGSEQGNFSSEFDGLMDLEDFEKLGSSDSMGGLEGLLDMDSDNWASDSGEENNASIDSGANAAAEKTEEKQQEISDHTEKAASQSAEKVQKKPSVEQAVPSGTEEFLDLDEEFIIEGEEPSGNKVENILNMGGATLKDDANLTGLSDVNDELLLDPQLDGKKEKKAFAGDKKKEKASSGKAGIFQKLFGNVPDENAEKNAAKEAERQAAKEAKKAAKKTKEEIALEKQEKQKAKDEAAAVKKAEQDAKKAKKEEEKKLKLAEKAAAKEAREQEEAKEPVTRINRVGASIIFVTFAIVAVVIIIGNNSYAYSQCIAKAAAFFGQKEYTNAYNQIYGVKVKKSDEELKDQVMTVMFVEKQLNSFDNFFAMEMYPQALDSLLKGLSKYDKYLEQARSLGIESDVNYVRDKIISELKSAFNLSEKSAYKLLSISDPKEYTEQVTKAANT